MDLVSELHDLQSSFAERNDGQVGS
jgi:hypothetical protein